MFARAAVPSRAAPVLLHGGRQTRPEPDGPLEGALLPVQVSQQPTPFGQASRHVYTHFQPTGHWAFEVHAAPGLWTTSRHCEQPLTSVKQKHRPESCGSQTGPTKPPMWHGHGRDDASPQSHGPKPVADVAPLRASVAQV